MKPRAFEIIRPRAVSRPRRRKCAQCGAGGLALRKCDDCGKLICQPCRRSHAASCVAEQSQSKSEIRRGGKRAVDAAGA